MTSTILWNQLTDGSLPLPPEPLRVRVGASPDIDVFRQMGRSLALTVAELASPLPGRRILDFGCGCGRVLRYLGTSFTDAEWYGADLDGEAISWGDRHLKQIAAWLQCGEWPPLPYENGSFDVVYAISVFTHLPEPMQLAWLEEFHRVLADDGMLIVSVYNEIIHSILPAGLRAQLDERGILYGDDGGTSGLPPSYQSCFHTRAYVLETWPRRFEISGCVDRAFFASQDAVLLRKRPGQHDAGGRVTMPVP